MQNGLPLESQKDKWVHAPRATDEMEFNREGFKAFSRLFIPKARGEFDDEEGSRNDLDA